VSHHTQTSTEFLITCWSTFMTVALTSLKLYGIGVQLIFFSQSICSFLSSWHGEWFFPLDLGHFGYYFRSLLILFKSSVWVVSLPF
jgi:hypothetical protein